MKRGLENGSASQEASFKCLSPFIAVTIGTQVSQACSYGRAQRSCRGGCRTVPGTVIQLECRISGADAYIITAALPESGN